MRAFFARALPALTLAVALHCGVAPLGAAESPTLAPKAMVAAADPRAVDAGVKILAAGGSAADAAIAVQLVLGLVEPQSSGIGGGGFLLHYEQESGAIESYDGRETAPADATNSLFTRPDGTPMDWPEAAVGGLPVGVPGVIRMLEMVHRAHGRLPWAELFKPAIELAESGFAVSPRLATMIAITPDLADFAESRAYFFRDDGAPKPAGTSQINKAYAETLRAVAERGGDAFYVGEIARDIVAAARSSRINPGLLSERDFATYEAKLRRPVCAGYRSYLVCGMGPPSSGGLTTLQILGLVERFDLSALQPDSAEAVHIVSEASRLAFADRNLYMADSDFVPVPVEGLLDKTYLAERSELIRDGASMGLAEPGAPPGSHRRAFAATESADGASTSHLSVVDAEGNAVSFTTSVERPFGSRLMVRGFLLNNQLTDFSFRAAENGEPVANRVEPGKRPRSSMSPTIVFDDDGEFYLAVGSPGGSRIIGLVAQTLIGMLDWGLDAQAAINLPRHINRNGATELEAATPLEALRPALESLGHEVAIAPMRMSGLHAVRAVPDGLEGAADPRREGVARGY